MALCAVALLAIAQGGLSNEYLFLTCFAITTPFTNACYGSGTDDASLWHTTKSRRGAVIESFTSENTQMELSAGQANAPVLDYDSFVHF